MPLWDVEEGKKSVLYQTILQFIFGDQNVRIELGLWNTKLFIIELDFHIFLNQSILMSKSKVMIKTLWLQNHIKTLCKMQIPHLREGKCVMNNILRPIFNHQNIGIKFNPWNTKLFIIELAFYIFLNHSILMSKSKVMIKTLWLHNHTKTLCETQISHLREGKCVMNKHFEAHIRPSKYLNQA